MNRADLTALFETGGVPTGEDFAALIAHADEHISGPVFGPPMPQLGGLRVARVTNGATHNYWLDDGEATTNEFTLAPLAALTIAGTDPFTELTGYVGAPTVIPAVALSNEATAPQTFFVNVDSGGIAILNAGPDPIVNPSYFGFTLTLILPPA